MLAKALRNLLNFKEVIVGEKTKSGWCPVCGLDSVAFAPLPAIYGKRARRYGYVHFGHAEMSSLDSYTCTNCGATDRERLYALWITQQAEKGRFGQDVSTIHFAPEKALSKKLRELITSYKTADLLMHSVDFRVDIMDLPFDNESFDFFLCSHVLEHVSSDDQAIEELYRITKRGGRGILMAPIVLGLKKTIEDPSVTDEAERWRLYGQNDHLRLYAHDDYVEKIRSHGFRVDELGENYFGTKTFVALGAKPTSILYVASK